MDFLTIDSISAAEKGFKYVVKDVYGNDTDCTVDVIGVGSRVYKTAKERINQTEAVYARRGKEMPTEESDELYIDLIAKCTKGWANVKEGEKEIPFTHDNAVMMYTKYPIFRTQILTAIHDIVAQLEGN